MVHTLDRLGRNLREVMLARYAAKAGLAHNMPPHRLLTVSWRWSVVCADGLRGWVWLVGRWRLLR
ncbi:hypothetical protein [Candidatus Mycobacterium methanotrophicum]|uniref:hypothetical protein n=1 Tax=Candidatus Mycobacterium methanotrophicum TaxID=2943498 RepID=UPI0027D995B6|nr:hypothetical protein [Candidatus Mycobacterium methanotrophicum]